MEKLFRTSTIPLSLNILLKGQLAFLSQHYHLTAISGEGKDLQEVRERENVIVCPIEMQRNISPIKDLISLVRLYRYFRKEKPLIVHSITPKAGLLTMLAGKMAGVPVRMHTFTGLIFPTKEGAIQKLLIAMDRLLCWAATNIYPEGNGVKQDLISYKITSKPLNVIANGNVNGIDIDYFSGSCVDAGYMNELRSSLGIRENDFVFIFVGRLVGDKGINELVAAFKNISAKNSDVKLILLGPFEEKLDPLLPETLAEINANPNIITTGFQNDVRSYYAISDALVFPSYREGFPNVVIQAGAMGLPAIVSNINGCNEIIIEGENGTIIPPRNSKLLETAMLDLFKDKELFNKLKVNSRRIIADKYKQELVWGELLKEYRRLESAHIRR